ncbi:acyl-phosphate glycerol 3-phosphate acyltransferase [Synechococcus sp. PCC 7502]|uniref:glycerol-3-phosphate 1-O-acyltransferase PlsY n=1 Tax=Synechococcus sp. PCC 7502 TaxID=1173263 RepID=UPI00029FD779|nr:glycerol-3-phosphate 1-O-acyltransferase PlsY [Synechococcus sp. PCC 7502]AFY72178.1 acyl-phosphate glycerol 3-phosphate acyltransferase [Synechococcus sp. PCC 7502]
MWTQIGLLAIAYLCGSLPTGYIVGRMAGIDIREHGSGSTGATNVWRTVGKQAGIGVFVVDLLKGLLAVLLMKSAPEISTWLRLEYMTNGLEYFILGAAMMALLGHTKSVWLGFKGGKAVASGLGVLIGLNWLVAIAAFGLWLGTMAIWRTVSISSITAAIATPILMIITKSPLSYMGFALVAGSYVVWLHRSNIQRLRQGTEPALFPTSSSK